MKEGGRNPLEKQRENLGENRQKKETYKGRKEEGEGKKIMK
jgi:hypothetical protein